MYVDPSGHIWTCVGANEDHCYDDGEGQVSGMVGVANQLRQRRASMATPTAVARRSTAWVIVCGIGYACTGSQNTSSQTWGVPAYNGWKEEIESHPENTAVFVPTTDPVENYAVLDYAAQVGQTISSSNADVINLICHSRGGQVCIHLANTLNDPRIATIFLLDPAVRDTRPDTHPAYDNASDYVNLVNNPNIESVLIVTSPIFNPHPDPVNNPPDFTFTFSGQDDHNEMVYKLDVIQMIFESIK